MATAGARLENVAGRELQVTHFVTNITLGALALLVSIVGFGVMIYLISKEEKRDDDARRCDSALKSQGAKLDAIIRRLPM